MAQREPRSQNPELYKSFFTFVSERPLWSFGKVVEQHIWQSETFWRKNKNSVFFRMKDKVRRNQTQRGTSAPPSETDQSARRKKRGFAPGDDATC